MNETPTFGSLDADSLMHTAECNSKASPDFGIHSTTFYPTYLPNHARFVSPQAGQIAPLQLSPQRSLVSPRFPLPSASSDFSTGSESRALRHGTEPKSVQTRSSHRGSPARAGLRATTATSTVVSTSSALCSRASYMCRKCKTHGHNILVKRHKRACPYMHCTCLKCHLVDQGRKVVAKQIALYRDQKGVPSKDGSTNSSSLGRELQSPTTIEWSTPRSQHSGFIDVVQPRRNAQSRYNRFSGCATSMAASMTLKSKQAGTAGPHCRRCRNHSLAVTWKGHKKTCPFRNCPCDPCRLINVRKDTEKTLREMVSHTAERVAKTTGMSPEFASYTTDSQSSEVTRSKPIAASDAEGGHLSTQSDLGHRRQTATKSRRTLSRDSMRTTDPIGNIQPNMVASTSCSSQSGFYGDRSKVPYLTNLTHSRVGPLGAPTIPSLWPGCTLDRPPSTDCIWSLRPAQLSSNELQQQVPPEHESPADWLMHPMSMNTTFEANHYHHHHHHHVHLAAPAPPIQPALQGPHNGCCRGGNNSGIDLGMLASQRALSLNEDYIDLPKFGQYANSSMLSDGNLQRTDSSQNVPSVWSPEHPKLDRCSYSQVSWSPERKACGYTGSIGVGGRNVGFCSCRSGADANTDFYSAERMSAVAAAAAAAAAMVAMAPPIGTSSRWKSSQSCHHHHHHHPHLNSATASSAQQNPFEQYYLGGGQYDTSCSLHVAGADETSRSNSENTAPCFRSYTSTGVEEFNSPPGNSQCHRLSSKHLPEVGDHWVTTESGAITPNSLSSNRGYIAEQSSSSQSPTSISFNGTEQVTVTNTKSHNLAYSDSRSEPHPKLDPIVSTRLHSAEVTCGSTASLQHTTGNTYLSTSVNYTPAAKPSYASAAANQLVACGMDSSVDSVTCQGLNPTQLTRESPDNRNSLTYKESLWMNMAVNYKTCPCDSTTDDSLLHTAHNQCDGGDLEDGAVIASSAHTRHSPGHCLDETFDNIRRISNRYTDGLDSPLPVT